MAVDSPRAYEEKEVVTNESYRLVHKFGKAYDYRIFDLGMV
jgi:hypothetical protein